MHDTRPSPPVTTGSTTTRRRRLLVVAAYVLGVYLVLRAVAEPFVIDMGDPSTYRMDWGGPTLVGVLAVHMGFGAAALSAMVWHQRRRRSG